jgi:hypothetical protein
MIRRAIGVKSDGPTFDNRPAVGRITVSSPAVMRPLEKLNQGKPYVDQIKPFNFLLSCHVRPFGHPTGVDPEQFHLISPYESDPRRWLAHDWIDQYSGKTYAITTRGHHGDRHTARVKSYSDVLKDYEVHPEAKYADASGNVCGKQTTGLLYRRHVRIDLVKYIGKESNSLEEVEAGLVHSMQNVYTEFSDPRRDEWATKILPVLRKIPVAMLQEQTGMSQRALRNIWAGRSRPHRKNQELLSALARQFERDEL